MGGLPLRAAGPMALKRSDGTGEGDYMRDYIARNPRTGKPLHTGRRRQRTVDLAYQPSEGAWDSLPLDRILGLATGEVVVESVIWSDREHLLRRADGVRALPRIRGRSQVEAHAALDAALADLDPRIRSAGLRSLPYCALINPENLFEHLHELLDDVDEEVQKQARACLVLVAPVFPSATEQTLRHELRYADPPRRRNAFDALKQVADVWPEVAELHIDELIREEDVDLRTQGAALLARLTRHKSATLWDLIGWSLQDEAVTVRRQAARALAPLAKHAPKVAQIALEIALFDEDDQVRGSALKAFKKLDPDAFRMQRLLMDGTRHSDRNIRMACIKMLPVILVETEVREQASELIQQETDPEIRTFLAELMIDESLEGTEDEKNRFLAPAPKVERDEGSLSDMPEMPPVVPPEEEKKKKPEKPAQPSQDELYYGEDFDEGTDDLI